MPNSISNMQKPETASFIFGLKKVDVIQFAINPAPNEDGKPEEFLFNLDINHKIDIQNHLIHVIVNISVFTKDSTNELARLSVLCIYEVQNIEEIVSKEGIDIQLPDPVVFTLNSIAISTARGIMYSYFKGTYLNDVLIPIVDPKLFKVGK